MARSFIAIALLALAGLGLLACGGHDGHDEEELTPRETDISFASAMIPHHDAAIQMARIARAEGEHAEVKALAASIIASQEAEISQMEAAYKRATGQKSQSREHAKGGMSHEMMGMSAEEMGMGMDPADLKGAKPFDRAFIDAMIPHHEGAVRMAEAQLANGEDAELKALSEAIIEAQTREIEEMETWRQLWYGD